MNKTLLLLFVSFLSFGQLGAQTTETFETVPAGSTSFTKNGQTFNITSQAPAVFDVYIYSGGGWNGTSVDNRFIDNSGTTFFNTPVEFAISSASAFTLKSFYLFLSKSDLSLNVLGALTITGKFGGAEKFTTTAISPFNPSMGVNNGFTFINMKTFGGTDNSNISIDEFVIKTSGNIAYLSLDALTWDNPVCEIPANVTSTNIVSDKARINWTNTGTFDLEWGKAGFTQGTGTKQNGVSALNYQITGLTESTSYDIYVRKNCTINQSNWVKHTFSTLSVCPGGDITLLSQADVNNFAANYPSCTQLTGSLQFGNYNASFDISNLSALSNIQSVGGDLRVLNSQLTNLNNFSSVTSISGELDISFNSELTDILGVRNINPAGITKLWIEQNPSLSDCNIASVCGYLQGSGARLIQGNKTGCQNENTVKTACSAVLSTSEMNKKGFVVYPNPFTDVINMSDIDHIESIVVNDVSGKLIKIIKPTKEINFFNNASGIYIINVKFNDGDIKSFKVIKK